MTHAGERDRLIAFYAVTVGQDAMGTETESVAASPLCREWAKVLFGTGQERRDAAAQGSAQSATFRVLSNTGTRAVTERHVIRFGGADWGIQSIAPIGGEIEFVATKQGI